MLPLSDGLPPRRLPAVNVALTTPWALALVAAVKLDCAPEDLGLAVGRRRARAHDARLNRR
jgi:hypothetical protein